MGYETKYKEVGLKVTNIKWIEFGKLLLNLDMLNHKKTLSVKYKSGAGIAKLRKTENLSEEFVSIINQLIDNKIFNYNLAKELDTNEKEMLINLLFISGLGKEFKIDPSQMNETIEEVKKRFNIIQGQIIAGNNNPLLLKKGVNLIRELIKFGVILESEGNEIIKELEN